MEVANELEGESPATRWPCHTAPNRGGVGSCISVLCPTFVGQFRINQEIDMNNYDESLLRDELESLIDTFESEVNVNGMAYVSVTIELQLMVEIDETFPCKMLELQDLSGVTTNMVIKEKEGSEVITDTDQMRIEQETVDNIEKMDVEKLVRDAIHGGGDIDVTEVQILNLDLDVI